MQWEKQRRRLKWQRETYEQQHFTSYHPSPPSRNNYQGIKIVSIHCDLCNQLIDDAPSNIEAEIDKSNEINDSFESEIDKSTCIFGPKLLLCKACSILYLIPSFIRDDKK